MAIHPGLDKFRLSPASLRQRNGSGKEPVPEARRGDLKILDRRSTGRHGVCPQTRVESLDILEHPAQVDREFVLAIIFERRTRHALRHVTR
jgi:hypothetical protein